MKLRCKIYPEYLKQIMDGKKKIEHRQLETIILVDSKTGEEHEFEIEDVEVTSVFLSGVKEKCPDVKWDGNKPVLVIHLGKDVKK